MPTGRPHPPEFKAKVVIRVVSGERVLNDVAAEYDLNPNLARKWRSKFEREAYNSAAYEQLLEDSHVLQSMDGKARWTAFAIVERWFGSLKSGCVKIEECETPRELRGIIDEHARKYDDRRLHESLDYETPASWCYSGIAAQLAA